MNSLSLWLTVGFGFLSFATLWGLLGRHADGRPLVAYEARKRVPWSFWAPVLVLAAPAINTIAAQFSTTITPSEWDDLTAVVWLAGDVVAAPSPLSTAGFAAFASTWFEALAAARAELYVRNLWLAAGSVLAMTAICYLCLATFANASRKDLGLPNDWREFVSDVRRGMLAWVAVLLPVYLIQYGLTVTFEPKQVHPLIEQYLRYPSSAMAAAATFSAVVAAPLFEETAFRLIFQGWLEKCEDRKLGFAATRRSLAADGRTPMAEMLDAADGALPLELHHDGASGDGLVELPREPLRDLQRSSRDHGSQSPADSAAGKAPPLGAARPSSGWYPGWPHGWTPVVISAVLFGLAHMGHGVAPVSLVLLGLALGYLYQRTHRIVAPIVCHMAFNAFSLLMLWIQVGRM
ncbi:MAG: CPBP family intramembrane glutamic endopeptidase [Planctomycetota bacterium]